MASEYLVILNVSERAVLAGPSQMLSPNAAS